MFVLKVIGLILCAIIVCWAVSKMVEHTINLSSLNGTRKYPPHLNRAGRVYNKKTKKLEADNSPWEPFD